MNGMLKEPSQPNRSNSLEDLRTFWLGNQAILRQLQQVKPEDPILEPQFNEVQCALDSIGQQIRHRDRLKYIS